MGRLARGKYNLDSFYSSANLVAKYVTPLLYSYEIIMAVEFHGRDFACATSDIVPAGQGYTDAAFQSCAYQGVEPGQLTLNGDNYIQSQFGFSYGIVGRNFGVLLLFWLAMLAINVWLVENVDWADGSGGTIEHAGAKDEKHKVQERDEETTDEAPIKYESSTTQSDGSCEDIKPPRSTFSWKNLDYFVGQGDNKKQLLRNISGYCTSGSLMALVGTSGAGKSTCESLPLQ